MHLLFYTEIMCVLVSCYFDDITSDIIISITSTVADNIKYWVSGTNTVSVC